MTRKLLWGSLALAPVTIAASWLFDLDETALFVLSALALVPLAWLIGEATDHAGEHTGPGIGGFLNASFGNAPELIIALLAIADSLPNVVRGSLAGSVVSNILLVLGFAMLAGPSGAALDRRSLTLQLGMVVVAVCLFLVPSVPAWHGGLSVHGLAVLTVPVAIALLVIYVAFTGYGLRRHAQRHRDSGAEAAPGWSLRTALLTLGIATVATAFVSEILVHSLHAFAENAGLSEFFVATVIVAIVGNSAEHGGAIVISHRGKLDLASEIAISSSAQVALLVAPVVALLSWAIGKPLPLSFRPVELLAMGGAALAVGIMIRDGKSHRWEGAALVIAYAGVAALFYFAGDR